MKFMGKSIFCDATFDVTLYEYRIVIISTLDGNKHHRPLMCSFITTSSATEWAEVFDIFNTLVVSTPPTFYVVTSDKEAAIRAGLSLSQLRDMAIHFTCSLHEKWNIMAHVCSDGNRFV